MKKSKWFSMLLSAALLLTAWTSWIPVTAAAEESADIYDTYTFQEFLDLSVEEVCAISEEAAEVYQNAKSDFAADLSQISNPSSYTHSFYCVVTDSYKQALRQVYAEKGDLEGGIQAASDLKIPFDWIDTFGYSPLYTGDGTEHMLLTFSVMICENYNGTCEPDELGGKTAVWLSLNPNILYVSVENTLRWEESADIYDTYTFEEFLDLSEEEVCAISEDVASAYDAGIAAAESIKNLKVNPCISFVTYEPYKNAETETVDESRLFSDLKIPESLIQCTGSTNGFTVFHVSMNREDTCTDAVYADMVAKAYVWIRENPNVELTTFCSLCLPVGPEPAPVCTGDANTDGKTSVLDVITISKYNAQQITLNEVQLLAADCNGDGTVNNEDVTALMRYLVELDDAMAAAS
ncbi:MAG: dockerin type I repeat-containing protein [Ruminococcus sp.]